MLYGMALRRGMELHGLEGIDPQVAVFDSIPMDSQVALLSHAMAERAYFVARPETTLQAWLRRDLAALWCASSFVVVGVLHLYGRKGLLQLLREQGYGVMRLY